ncbi:hypothetical protein RHSIM_Rhsim13G0019600 [Rhododendron simsii]|uniref:TMV resistance protein N n=1 Tax=Rhododendron simsii TaxID=118357 RepID=A0A834G226_RHOSS|nr:hypothetical protein RHSIM_Rhsim13G0019600 [Rhododendron simsii]
MENCNLSSLPNEVGNLISLETLNLGKNKLRTLPDSICNLTRLVKLNLSKCDVSHLPGEIGRLISLERLDLPQNNLLTLPDSFCNLVSLRHLNLGDYNLSHLPDRIGKLSSLLSLSLERNNVCSLPNSFSDLASLQFVHLSYCKRLQSLPKLPEWSESTYIYLPGDEVPNRFQYQYTGSKLSLVVPPLETRRILGCSLCVVFRTHEDCVRQKSTALFLHNKHTKSSLGVPITPQDQDQMILFYFPSKETALSGRIHAGDEFKFEIKLAPWSAATVATVKKCGINLIYEDNTEMHIKKKRNITDTRDSDISSPRN